MKSSTFAHSSSSTSSSVAAAAASGAGGASASSGARASLNRAGRGGALREEGRGSVRAAPRIAFRPRGDAAVPVPYPVLLVGLDERLAPEPV